MLRCSSKSVDTHEKENSMMCSFTQLFQISSQLLEEYVDLNADGIMITRSTGLLRLTARALTKHAWVNWCYMYYTHAGGENSIPSTKVNMYKETCTAVEAPLHPKHT